MASSSIELLKNVYRDLRHRPLLRVIGQTVRITSALSIEPDLRDLLRPMIVRLRDRGQESIKLAVVKHGILDLTFRAEGVAWRIEDSIDIPFLQRHGFVPDSDEDNGLRLLGELEESIRRDETIVRLFLEEDPPRDLAAHLHAIAESEDAPDPFPRNFMVRDACVTNASLLWVHKYFYS